MGGTSSSTEAIAAVATAIAETIAVVLRIKEVIAAELAFQLIDWVKKLELAITIPTFQTHFQVYLPYWDQGTEMWNSKISGVVATMAVIVSRFDLEGTAKAEVTAVIAWSAEDTKVNFVIVKVAHSFAIAIKAD